MNQLDRTRQDLCNRLVEREVMCCASSLISTLTRIAGTVGDEDLDYDTLIALCSQPDYETPGTYFIEQDADLNQLEEIADHFGDWEEFLDTIGYNSYVATQEEAGNDDPDNLQDWLKGLDAGHYKEGSLKKDSFMWALRQTILELVDDWSWVCMEFNLDPDYREAYEHWVVTGWLARKLAEEGEMVGDVLNLPVWGRCTTGQSMSIDGVIERITAKLWPEEWEGAK